MKPLGNLPTLVVHDSSESGAAVSRAMRQIIGELEAAGTPVLEAADRGDGTAMIATLYRFKTRRTLSNLRIHEISYAVR